MSDYLNNLLLEVCEDDNMYTIQTKQHLAQRKIILNDVVDEDVVRNITLNIFQWNKEDKDIPIEKRKPIWLYLNSPGGDVTEGLNVIDVIKASQTPVYTVCFATCASMAFHIFIAGHKRYCFKNSILLIHDGEVSISNSSSKAKDTMKFIESLDERVKQHILENTKITSEFYESIYDTEYYLFANDKGKELGCVDYIIGEDVPLSTIL
jgi:ATP-dependent Clp protease, protease subunit|nr:MAG TPA: hypothetical protein [Caudoviricetes sp.]